MQAENLDSSTVKDKNKVVWRGAVRNSVFEGNFFLCVPSASMNLDSIAVEEKEDDSSSWFQVCLVIKARNKATNASLVLFWMMRADRLAHVQISAKAS
jgi:hypothetical protein